MNKTFPAALAATCLLLVSGCSSDAGESPTPATPRTPNTPAANTDEAFCDALLAWGDEVYTMGGAMSELGSLLSAVEDPSNLPSPDLLHDFADIVLASADGADAALDNALSLVDDPEVVNQVREMNSMTLSMARWMGEAARDSDDVLAFAIVILEEYDMLMEFEDTLDALDFSAADAYVSDRCGAIAGFGSSTASGEDTETKYAVATLGKEIATYYVDADESIDPVISIVGGDFYLLDTNIGPAYENLEVTGQYYEGATDWCVEVTNSAGDTPTFRYSATGGLEAGTCS